MTLEEEATELLRGLHAQGLSLEECLDRMRGCRLGLIPLLKAMRTVTGINLRDGVELLERRGDYKAFSR